MSEVNLGIIFGSLVSLFVKGGSRQAGNKDAALGNKPTSIQQHKAHQSHPIPTLALVLLFEQDFLPPPN
jgi:hypothetical protein